MWSRHDPMGTLRAATSPAALDALWTGIGMTGPVPSVDLGRVVVVSITIPDDLCPPSLDGFERTESTVLTPLFTEPPGCRQPLVPRTFVAAIDRSSVAPSFTLRLPGSETFGFDEQHLQVVVG
jgi:hypothetical protein